MDRRTFVRGMCYGGLATFTAPLVTFGQVPGRGRFVFVLLRGGFDGLAAVVPVGDPGYAALRGEMAFPADQLVSLTGPFALAPGLSGLKEFWDAGELAAIHALAIPYRTRSHFDGQAVLETGLDQPVGSSDGWLNRLLHVMGGECSGIAVSAGLPLSLEGPHPVLTWSPAVLGVVDGTYCQRLQVLYQRDPVLHDYFEAAIQLQTHQEEMMGMRGTPAGRGGGERMSAITGAVARFLTEPGGPNVAAVEFSGWDTHANQGMAGGPLDRLFAQLSEALITLKRDLGVAWSDTTVVVMTEFGRTARPNGTGGTDHGTAGAGFVLGPRVAGSTVFSDWPGLAERDLYERRDLRPTLDTRAVLKSAIQATFDLTLAQADRIFPGSEGVRPATGLML
ncbi:MAG: DUF1501 domain-containing protein [Gemmatimonadetes bacterium]|nr:DUF1501 domain-containing protein [Gemmatimonadota bacterium]